MGLVDSEEGKGKRGERGEENAERRKLQCRAKAKAKAKDNDGFGGFRKCAEQRTRVRQ